MKLVSLLLLSSALLTLAACDTSRRKDKSHVATAAGPVAAGLEQNGIRLTPFHDSPDFPAARLQLNTPSPNASVPSGAVAFDYRLEDFHLTSMTHGAHAGEMANSEKGQHIHNIVDNEPYTAHYTTHITKNIPDGAHVVLSFLSRSYHESLKHTSAYDLRIITVGKTATPPLAIDLKAPHLFYSRPKDVYSGQDTKKVMLDFYLVNTALAPDGNKVRATINGTEFLLTEWAPFLMEGLPMGQNTIKLELLDDKETPIPGPFNPVTRTFTLQP